MKYFNLFEIKSKFNGECKNCNQKILAGDNIYIFPLSKRVLCLNCGERTVKLLEETIQDKEFSEPKYYLIIGGNNEL
jgi:hypothetical protein